MLVMAKKKPSEEQQPDPHKGVQTPFRAVDGRLLDALDGYAKSIRRSRNMAINLLLEEILQQKGFWPPR